MPAMYGAKWYENHSEESNGGRLEYTPIEGLDLSVDTSDISAAQAEIDGLQQRLNDAASATDNFSESYDAMKAEMEGVGAARSVDEYTAAIYGEYERIFPALKEYERGSEDYMAALNDMWGQTQETVDLTTESVENLNTEIEDANKSSSMLLNPRQGIILAGAGASDIGGLSLPRVSSQEELEAYASTVFSLLSYSKTFDKNTEETANKAAGYVNELNLLSEAFADGGISAAITAWQSLDDAIKNSVANTYPFLVQALGEAALSFGQNTQAVKEFQDELDAASFKRNAKYFTATANAADKLKAHTLGAADAYASFYSEAEKAIAAQGEYLTALDKTADGAKVTTDDVETLAKFLGFVTPDALLQSWDQVGPMLTNALDEGTEALQRMNEAAFIQITGTSVADFSSLTNGLVDVQNMAQETIEALIQTGQWELETVKLPQEGASYNSLTKSWNKVWLSTNQTVLKYTGKGFGKGKSTYKSKNSASASGGGSSGGGGGGGGGSSKGMTEVERMLDRMAQIQSIQGHTKSLYSAEASYYAQSGQLQGVIQYYEKERAAIERQNATLRANLDEMEPWLEKKKAEVESLKVSDARYEEAAKDLKALQERHQQYTIALINNTSEMDKLTESIKEQKDAIRKMEIDLRNTILEAIKDREALKKNILQGTVETENTILSLIKKRYEKERDMILESSQRQIDALSKERDLLDEQLQKRREMAEEEDKAAKLAELEAQYVRIAADPTRQKEAMSIQKEINELRDEMAWDVAEKEVDAQQESIDQQVESLEDYMEYIENYYEYLFEHPQQLIDEMREIMMGTDEEIIAWLQANDEEYAKSTQATQETMVNGWKETLRQMRGELELYWDEVEEIVAGGDDYIIDFLTENSAKYREAGKLQAEAYVDEWKKQLQDLRKAYEEVNANTTPADYVYIAPSESNSSGGGDGDDYAKTGLKITDPKIKTNLTVEKSGAGIGDSRKLLDVIDKSPTRFGETVLTTSTKPAAFSFLKFATGGVAGSDGLAWVDDKERILTPYQTGLFDSLVHSMELMSRAYLPSMPYLNDAATAQGGAPVNVGDIIVNVDKMDADTDYEEMAEKVFNALMERLNRGSVVGGIRYAY